VATARQILERLLAELADGIGRELVPGGSELVRAGALRAIEADLRRANLASASLRRADMRGASMRVAIDAVADYLGSRLRAC